MPIQKMLQKYNNISLSVDIANLFDSDPCRFQTYSCQFENLLLDFSKTSITSEVLDDLLLTAGEAGLATAKAALFSGAVVNASENRGSWHTLLRDAGADRGDARWRDLAAERSRMLSLADSLRAGRLPGTSNTFTDVVHLGIGGSSLGPRLVTQALGKSESDRVRLHYLDSADGHAVTKLMRQLDPKKTIIIVASKSFSTRETLLNATVFKDWLRPAADKSQPSRMLAITADSEAAREFGIATDLTLKVWPEIGGRFSVWSSIGLPIATALGDKSFLKLLAGANSIDEHFRTAPGRTNLPVLLALCGIWHRNICGYQGLACIPYDYRLRLFPDWLQQLDMESNGKSTDATGAPLPFAASPAIIGGLGTTSQHSIFQSLHQGVDITPVEFIGVLKPDHDLDQHHALQLANLVAQGEALMRGRNSAETGTFMQAGGADTRQLEQQLPHRTFAGNRPSITLLMDDLTPYHLGQLMALYEHKVFTQSVIWNTNAFDQWGVEFGKTLAGRFESQLESDPENETPPADLLAFVRARISR